MITDSKNELLFFVWRRCISGTALIVMLLTDTSTGMGACTCKLRFRDSLLLFLVPNHCHLVVLPMIFDSSLPEFLPGSSSNFKPRFSPDGLVSMSTVISDPTHSIQRTSSPIRKWTRVRKNGVATASWVSHDEDINMAEPSSSFFLGEEVLIPDDLPESVWQVHFRNSETELTDRKETEFLLQLYKQTSGRWPVIYDRWQMHPVYGPRGKSLESLKARFARVILKLIEADLLQRRKPSTSMERLQVSQQIKYQPIHFARFNEKHEYLRRLFLQNAFKRTGTNEVDKLFGELMRVPSLNLKKRLPQSKPPLTSGPHASSNLVSVVQSEVSTSEYSRIKAILKAVGIDRTKMTITPKVLRLLAVVEKEAATLLMMRDSLQRKKQELELLRTSTGSAHANVRSRYSGAPATNNIPPGNSTGTVNSSSTPALTPGSVIGASNLGQQKRKR
jgi:hypothetical protein